MTICVHKGWLAYAAYPQPLQGFILRGTGNHPTWKADSDTLKFLAPFPSNLGFSYSDPRPGVQSARFLRAAVD